MTTIITRAGKGSPLTNNEMDQNLINLNNDKVENVALAAYAPLNTPAFTGTPTAPTPAASANNTQLATTAFVNNFLSSNPTTSNNVSYNPSLTGSVTSTVQTKLKESISVKDFGAVGNGIADDTNAFILASQSTTGVIHVPPGTYYLASDVNAPNSYFQLEGATLTGEGVLITENKSVYNDDGLYVGNLSGYVSSTGFTRSIADLALLPMQHYPRKYIPTACYLELLHLSPSVTAFEKSDGTAPNSMNEQYFREMLREMFSYGIREVIISYVEYLGFWFYRPSFPYPYDYDTSRDGQFWKDWLTTYPDVIGFDVLKVIYEEADKVGAFVYAGLGRNGDTPLLNDLYTVWSGGADPMRYGLTITQRNTNAIERTRQVANDLHNLYGAYQSFAGFYISHESNHITSSNQYFIPVNNTTAGTYPALGSYGYPIIESPANPIDFAVDENFANQILASGLTTIMPQDSVGPGYNYVTRLYTYCPYKTISQLNNVLQNWKNVMRIVNGKAFSGNRNIGLYVTLECWQMGYTPAASVTLDATSGTFNVTASGGVFVPGHVGAWFTGSDGGNAQITAYVSPTVVTVTTGVTGGVAFTTTAYGLNDWSINSQYTNSYPADINRVENQFFEEAPWVSGFALYTWFGYIESGQNSLRLMQTNSNLLDYRTRAESLYNGLILRYKKQLLKYRYTPECVTLQKQFFVNNTNQSGTTITEALGSYYGLSAASLTRYTCNVRAFTSFSATASQLTVNLLINGVVVQSVFDAQSGGNQLGGSYNLVYEMPGKGLKSDIAVQVIVNSGTVSLYGASCDVEEYVQ